MFTITIVAVGKLKEPFYRDACAEYAKRLGRYCHLEVVELPEQRLAAIRARIPKGAWVCVLTPEGKTLSSEELAGRLRTVKTGGVSSACFILGSSFGLDPAVKALADFRLSLSPMTFPHHLARVMLLEQLYRAETIQAGGRYHK